MIIRIESSITLLAQNTQEAETLVNEWINGLLDKKIILNGGIQFMESFEEMDFDEPFPPDFNFPGYDNYPGHPL